MRAHKIQDKPLRYLVEKKEQPLLTIGNKTYHYFFKQKTISNDSTNPFDLKTIIKKEYHFLLEELYLFLARKDVSPRKLESWFEKRKVHQKLKDKIKKKITKEKFYAPERFLTNFVDHRFATAKKPWWIVKKELIQEGFSKEEIEEHAFDDRTMLENFYESRKIDDELTFIKKLQRRGFSYGVVDKLLAFKKNLLN